MGTDATCRVGDALGVPAAEGGSAQQVSLVFWLIHRKALLQGQAYTVQSLVRNPQQADWPSSLPWRLESYQRFIATGQKVRLDSSVLAGQSITPPADTFQITNSAAEHTTSAKVYGVQFTLQLPHPLLTGDSIDEVTAPPGFELRANGSNTSNASRCLDFRWQDTWRPLRLDVEPYCDCSSSVDFGHVCSLIVNVSFLSPEDVLGADTPVGFEMSVWNPAGPNAPVRNWWGMRHWRSDGRLLSSAFAEGWPILGTLQNMSAFISGYRQRAGSQSDITLLFTPTLWASAVDLVFHEPPGFDFSTVRPSSPLIRHAFTQGSRVVLANGDFRPNLPGEVFLGEVMLGSGGPTRISMQLFADARMEQEVARRLNFFQGFVQPGALQIDSQQLLSEDVTEHYEGDAYDSVLPLLPCFAKQRARIDIFFQLSQYAMAGEIFVLKNLSPQPERLHELVSEEGYEPLLEFCAGADGGREENTTLWQCDRVLPVNHSAIVFSRNNFDILDGFSTRLLPKADVYVTDQAAKDQIAWITDGSGALAMEANRNYRLRLWILPTSIASYERESPDLTEQACAADDAWNQARLVALLLRLEKRVWTLAARLAGFLQEATGSLDDFCPAMDFSTFRATCLPSSASAAVAASKTEALRVCKSVRKLWTKSGAQVAPVAEALPTRP
ncbi:unnamed protein product [Effrenium voratum]|nr:unnamed protein product [Effrenium voratum]